jgi:hypothetical protein
LYSRFTNLDKSNNGFLRFVIFLSFYLSTGGEGVGGYMASFSDLTRSFFAIGGGFVKIYWRNCLLADGRIFSGFQNLP